MKYSPSSRIPGRRRIVSFTAALSIAWAVGSAWAPAAAVAFSGQPSATTLTWNLPSQASVGATVPVDAILTDMSGQGVEGQTVSLSVAGMVIDHARTGPGGRAQLSIPAAVIPTAGTYAVEGEFSGSSELQAAAVAGSLAVSYPIVTASYSGPPTTQTAGPGAVVDVPTVTGVEVPTGSVLGSDVSVVAVLPTRTGTPLSEHVTLNLDGNQVRGDRTDATGKVTLIIPAKYLLEARAYTVQVVFAGAHGLAPSAAQATLTILAAAIQIQTVPPLPNLRFTLGSETAFTGPDGVAALPVPKAGSYPLTADLNPDTSPTATVKASFVRWLDNVYTANRTIDVTGPATYVMGLRVAYRASIQYIDLNNNPVDQTLVDQAQFSTGTGANDIVLNSQTGAKDVWWTAATAVRYGSQLQVSEVTYRALSVQIHGAQVVNRGQQAWTPTENGAWVIQLLLYSMTVQTRDAMFGTPVPGELTLTYPDGAEVSQHLDSDGRITFSNLPRGQYHLALSPVAFSPPAPVALSRIQESTLRVVTYQDVGTIVGLLLVVGALVIGRWVILSRRIKRRLQESLEASE
jgi:hypothetical protein